MPNSGDVTQEPTSADDLNRSVTQEPTASASISGSGWRLDATQRALVQSLRASLHDLEDHSEWPIARRYGGEIIARRFGLVEGDPRRWTLREIGEPLNLSRQRIAQIETRVLRELHTRAPLLWPHTDPYDAWVALAHQLRTPASWRASVL